MDWFARRVRGTAPGPVAALGGWLVAACTAVACTAGAGVLGVPAAAAQGTAAQGTAARDTVSAIDAAPGGVTLDAAQDGGYREPPRLIRQILDAPPTPAVLVAPGGRMLLLLGRAGMPPIAELAEPELRLAGGRINPATNGPGRTGSITALTLVDVADGAHREVQLPDGARIAFVQWSPDGGSVAFTNAVDDGIELWLADVRSARARRLTDGVVNAAMSSPYAWLPDASGLVVRQVVAGRGPPPVLPRAPAGPVVQQTDGRAVAVRTYQDVLTGPHDEALFDYYFTGQLVLQPVTGGAATPIGAPGIITTFSVSPDASHLLLTRVQRPYSYVMNMTSFGSVTEVIDMSGARVHTVEDRKELALPVTGGDMVVAAPRAVHWRADAPATLAWAEPADGGDARRDAAVRDRVLLLDAPFTAPPRTLVDLPGRYAGLQWSSAGIALVHSRWTTTASARSYVVDPAVPGGAPRLLWERSTDARYDHPGTPVMTTNRAGQPVLRISADGTAFYLTGSGASERGSYPFLDRAELAGGRTERLWQARAPHYESVVAVLDDAARSVVTRRESEAEPPNYFVRDRNSGAARALTRFADPAPQLAGLQRRLLTYQRDDGVTLSATLYTPAGYDEARDGPLPMLVWAYPREFRDAAAASQVSGSTHRFSRPSGLSPLMLLTQGYAVLDGPGMAIIGSDDAEPNDTFVEQLVSSARAAVDAVVALGVADRDRIAVAGHSYGAFMTANLLAHTDLFRAGIALSGAYNRTLTPFGFQSERRSYWQARDVYDRMSPFAFADRIRTPLLLVHGAADSNPGTFPLQSERMYQALAGHGAPARFVSLPHEDHGYAARESIMHVLAEMVAWLDTHVKQAAPRR